MIKEPWEESKLKLESFIILGTLANLRSLSLLDRFAWQNDDLTTVLMVHAPGLQVLKLALTPLTSSRLVKFAFTHLKSLHTLNIWLLASDLNGGYYREDIAAHCLGALTQGSVLDNLERLSIRGAERWMVGGFPAPKLRILELYSLLNWKGGGPTIYSHLEHLRIHIDKSGFSRSHKWNIPTLKTLEIDSINVYSDENYRVIGALE